MPASSFEQEFIDALKGIGAPAAAMEAALGPAIECLLRAASVAELPTEQRAYLQRTAAQFQELEEVLGGCRKYSNLMAAFGEVYAWALRNAPAGETRH